MEYPEEIWSDNGPQFASHLFAEFTKDWNIKHSTSSPRNPRSNGQAESAVKIVKGLLTHAKCSGQDPYLALLAYRSTPVDSYLQSPAKMFSINVPYAQLCHKGSGTRTPICSSWMWRVRRTCNIECSYPWPYRWPQESPTLCRTVCFCNQQWQDTVAPCHCSMCSQSWLLHLSKSLVELSTDWAWDDICEHHPDAVKPDAHPKIEVAGQPVTTPSTSEAVQLQQVPTAPTVQPSVAPATPKQAAAQSPTAAIHTQWKTPATADVKPPTGRTVVTPHRSGHVSKASQCLIEHM